MRVCRFPSDSVPLRLPDTSQPLRTLHIWRDSDTHPGSVSGLRCQAKLRGGLRIVHWVHFDIPRDSRGQSRHRRIRVHVGEGISAALERRQKGRPSHHANQSRVDLTLPVARLIESPDRVIGFDATTMEYPMQHEHPSDRESTGTLTDDQVRRAAYLLDGLMKVVGDKRLSFAAVGIFAYRSTRRGG